MRVNLFDLPDPLPRDEEFRDLVPERGVKIERIVSNGQATPEGTWYDQDRDEWVAVIQGAAVLEFENGDRLRLARGDHTLIRLTPAIAWTTRAERRPASGWRCLGSWSKWRKRRHLVIATPHAPPRRIMVC